MHGSIAICLFHIDLPSAESCTAWHTSELPIMALRGRTRCPWYSHYQSRQARPLARGHLAAGQLTWRLCSSHNFWQSRAAEFCLGQIVESSAACRLIWALICQTWRLAGYIGPHHHWAESMTAQYRHTDRPAQSSPVSLPKGGSPCCIEQPPADRNIVTCAARPWGLKHRVKSLSPPLENRWRASV